LFDETLVGTLRHLVKGSMKYEDPNNKIVAVLNFGTVPNKYSLI